MAGPALFLTLDYPPMVGGVANYYSQLIKHLPPQSIVVVDNHDQELTSPWLKTWFVLRRYWKRYQFSALIVGQVLPIGTVVWLWHTLFATPYIVYTHGMDITTPQRYWRKRMLLRHILSAATYVVTVSRFSRTQLQALLPKAQWKKIIIIPPSPTVTPQMPAEPIIDQLPSHYMLSVGRLVQRKGLDVALQALAQLPKTLQDWHYVIAGAGPERKSLEALAAKLRIQQRVHFVGQVTNGQLAELYKRCRFLIMPAKELPGDFEGFGTVILEANSFAKPAIGSLTGGIPDAIVAEVTGILVEPDNVAQLVLAVTGLATNEAWCQQLGQQAQNYVQANHLWSVKAQQFDALLKQL